MNKIILLVFIFILAACQSPIQKTDDALRLRIEQMELAVGRVKTDTIDEAKKAAQETADKTIKTVEGAVDRKLEVVDAKIDSKMTALSTVIDDKIIKLQKGIHEELKFAIEQTNKASEERVAQLAGSTSKIIKEDVPVAIEKSIVASADRIAERFGVIKKTETGPDGIPIEVWTMGGVGAAGVIVNVIRNYLNSKHGARRYTKEEFETHVAHTLKKLGIVDSDGNKPS